MISDIISCLSIRVILRSIIHYNNNNNNNYIHKCIQYDEWQLSHDIYLPLHHLPLHTNSTRHHKIHLMYQDHRRHRLFHTKHPISLKSYPATSEPITNSSYPQLHRVPSPSYQLKANLTFVIYHRIHSLMQWVMIHPF